MSTEPNMMRGMFRWATLLALLGGTVATAGMALYSNFGSALLTPGDNGVSRLFVGEAERMGRAGEPDRALALYEEAFRAGFGYPPDKSRALTLKGMVLWRMGRVKETADALSEAASGSAPNFDGAQALVEALLHLKRMDEAQSVVRRWREAMGDKASPQIRADMLYSTGRIAQERGDLGAAKAAYEESAATVPGSLAEYLCGILCAEAGNVTEARQHLERFLVGGASGDEAARARASYRSLGSNSDGSK